jgi:hypothetical protein
MGNAKGRDVVLLRAKIESIDEMRDILSKDGEVNIGSQVKVRLGSIEPLIGNIASTGVEVDLTMAAIPRADKLKDVYVLGKRLLDGSLQALRWDYSSTGLCVGHDMAKAYLIEDDLMLLRRSGEVNWNPDCDW